MSGNGGSFLRDARDILGPTATPVELILAADFIRLGYLNDKAHALIEAIGVERLRNPEPVEFELAETEEPATSAVTGAHSSVEFGFAPEVDDYWTEEDRGPRRRR